MPKVSDPPYQHRLLELVSDRGPMKWPQIAERDFTAEMLLHCEAKGWVHRYGRQGYFITDAGSARLKGLREQAEERGERW